MHKILNVYKPIGFTPLQVIDLVREKMPELKDEKIGYAGRLDPLAHGVLLLMVGDAAKERDTYLGLTKTYAFEVLFGVETDTYDILGSIQKVDLETPIVREKVNVFVSSHIGNMRQTYPPYSSKTVGGKPLFWWARNNKLHEITLPEREISIESLRLVSFGEISKNALQKKIETNISLVKGDFRQAETLKGWNNFFQKSKESFQTAKFEVTCSSGTYVRGLVNDLGKVSGCGAIALDINRTRVGSFSKKDSINV